MRHDAACSNAFGLTSPEVTVTPGTVVEDLDYIEDVGPGATSACTAFNQINSRNGFIRRASE